MIPRRTPHRRTAPAPAGRSGERDGAVALVEIPDKQYFKIGEVSQVTGVEAHVLRYWETEFPQIRPEKSRTNQRLYSRGDVEVLLEIKRLLYDEGFTIAGARRRLRELARGASDSDDTVRALHEIRVHVEELIALVDGRDPERA